MAEDFLEQDSQPVLLTQDEELIVKEAVARHQHVLNIDSAGELKRFKQSILWRQKKRRFFWAAVASLIIIVGVGAGLQFFRGHENPKEPLIVYEATESTGASLLYMDGKPITLNSDAALLALQKLGAEVTDDGIKYSAEGKSMMNTITTTGGQKYTITLSDGTMVQLNSHTTFTYPTVFTELERKVMLIGEAYFTVAKDAAHPFIVNSEELDTKVLGTEFNIRNYGGEPSTVTLVKGSIEVKAGKNEPVVLKPGQTLSYYGTGYLKVEENDVREYTEWKSGFFYFNEKTLAEVFRIIGRYYNVTVECDNWDVLPTKLNLWIDMNKTLEENLKLINEVAGLNVRKEGNKVIIN